MFRINGIKSLFLTVLTAVVLTATGSFAQNNDYYIQLTRISMIEGNVGYQRVPDEEWNAAGVNMPLEPGDRIYTGRGGRVEIEFEEGSVLRLAENTDIEILTLDEDFVHLRMLLGIASITVEGGVVFETGTPAAAFITEANGLYRFEVSEDGRSEAIVRKGRLETVNNNFTRATGNNDLIRVYADSRGPVVSTSNRRDAWDEWTDRRDADRRVASSARRYIPNNVSIGVSELDRHGRWVYVTNYGWGWVPYSVASGWAPYSVGRWVYRPRFGWTWVSYETWGWLPYHYGRWYRDARFGWTWFPGESVTFRFWSPGLVVFYRGSGWVSWGPLGPGDYYDVAYYHYRRIYVSDLARVRVLIVRQPGNYINRNVRGAFQTVNTDHFRGINTGGQNNNARRNDINQPWRQGTLVRGGLDVSPARESYRPAPERRAERPQVETNRPVVVRRTPAQASGNDGRFTQVNNPRVTPAQDRLNTDRGNSSGNTAGRRQDENRPETPGAAAGSPSGVSRDRPSAPAQSSRPAQGTTATNRNDSGGASGSAGENPDRSTTSRPAAPQENRPSERPNTGGASSSTRENNRPATGSGASSGRDQQAAPAQNSRPTPEAPATNRNNSGGSPGSAGENRDRPGTSRPAPAQESRPSERPSTGGSSNTRSNNQPATGGSSSGSRNQQAAPAQNSRPAPGASSTRQNNPGSSAGQSAPRTGQPNDARSNRTGR